MKRALLLIILLTSNIIISQQLIGISPVSENTILLHFDEGEKDFSNFSEFFFYSAPNLTYYGQINEQQSLITSNFTITSSTDTFYNTPQQASATFFKAKEQVALMEYYVYVTLPQAMQSGNSYTINVNNINADFTSYTLNFDEFSNFSESIHVNQIGMMPSSTQKVAYVSQWLGKNGLSNSHFEDFTDLIGTTCHVVKASDNSIIYSGSGANGLQFRAPITEADYPNDFATQFWYNSPVWDFDFSEVGTTIDVEENEDYKIVIEGIGSSFPFKISNKVYDDIYKTIANSLVYQRSGFDRDNTYAPFLKPVDHIPGVDGFEITYSNYRRMDNVNGDEESFEQLPAQATNLINPTNVAPWMTSPDSFPWGSGGHFDAGDFDVYIQHLSIPIITSLVYKMAPNGFKDGDLNIPENNNGIPDVLDEVKWTLDFFRRTKGPTGGVCGGKETTGYFGPAHNDGSGDSSSEQMWYVYKEDPAASYAYAAAAAIYADALQIAGDPNNEAQTYIDDAIAVYNWANANATASDLDQEFSGFIYAGKVQDLKLTAASMLYGVTGIQTYLDYYKNNTVVTQPTDFPYQYLLWDESLANWYYTLIPNDKWSNFDASAIALKNTQIQTTITWSDDWGVNDISMKPFRHIKSQYQPPILGTTGSTPQLLPQIMAHYHTNNPILLNQMLTSNDMYLGGNAENKVYISRADTFGAERYAKEVLHDACIDNAGVAIPGIPLYTHNLDKQDQFLMSPPVSDWPYMEINLDARVYFLQSEFTVAQNTIPTMVIYGYLNSLFNPDLILSVIDFSSENDNIKVYPNPNKGVFTIQLKNSSVTPKLSLMTLNGQLLDFESSNTSEEIIVKTQNLSDGFYILRLDFGDTVNFHKILIRD